MKLSGINVRELLKSGLPLQLGAVLALAAAGWFAWQAWQASQAEALASNVGRVRSEVAGQVEELAQAAIERLFSCDIVQMV